MHESLEFLATFAAEAFSVKALAAKPPAPLAALLLLGAFAAASPPPASAAEPWPSDLAAAKTQAAREGRLIVVDLFAEWCGWCKVLEKDVFTGSLFEEFARDKILVRLDVEDGAEGSRVQTRFEVYNLPTTLILDADEVLVGQIQGFAAAEPYVAQMRHAVEAFQRLEAAYERAVSAPGETSPEQLRALAATFHERRDGERAAALYQRLETLGWSEPQGEAMLPFRRADALRLAGRWEEAAAAATKARRLAVAAGNDEVVEAIDLLGIQIATDLGDCEKRRSALEGFLRLHPKSAYTAKIASSLSALESGRDGQHCSS
jgi:thiol-disulfide isomerase/thioredoxin